jgi:AraC-like DNA-binding protein
VPIEGAASPALTGKVSGYYGFQETTPTPVRRREGPRPDVVLIISFGDEWVIDGARFTSFVGGLHRRQVTTEHGGRSFGIHVDLAPPTAHMLFRLPMHLLAERVVSIEDVLDEPALAERLHDAGRWADRFRLLDEVIAKRLADARPPSSGVVWAWRRLVETDGRIAVGTLAEQLGWSRKRMVVRFREEIGLPPKAVARLLRFDRARQLAEDAERPDWARIAAECGYYDQSHLSNDFRAVTGRTPATFFQDTVASAA